jgi:hypothetical protein
MKLHLRIAALGAVSVLLFAACGGGSSSSSRTRNAALDCYADLDAKNVAVADAQAAFDASFGGNPPPSDDSVPDSSVPDTSVPDTSVPTSDSSVPDTTMPKFPEPTAAASGGYRRPAVRHFATVPPTQPGDSVPMTDEQRALQLAMQAAEEMPLCESSDTTTASEASSDTTIASDTETINCTGTVSGTVENRSHSTDCPDGDFVVFSDENGNMVRLWMLIRWSDQVRFAEGYIDLSTLSADNPIVVNISYKKPVSESGESSDTTIASDSTIASDTTIASGPYEPGCPGDVPTIGTDVESPTTQNIVQVSTSNPSGECDSSIYWVIQTISVWEALLRGEPFASAPLCSSMSNSECDLDAGDYVIIAAYQANIEFGDSELYEGWQNNVASMNFTVTGGGESGTCEGVQLRIVDQQWVGVDDCSDSLNSFSLAGLGPIPLRFTEGPAINIEGPPAGWIDMTYIAGFTDGSTERGSFTQCWTSCDQIEPLRLFFSPENPKIGDAIWFLSDFAECDATDWFWRVYLSDNTLFSSSPFHQPFTPSQSRKYRVRATGICSDGSEVYAEADIEPQAIAAPAHDNITDAQGIEGVKGSATGTTLGATREIDEPVHTDCPRESEATSWLIWTAPETGALTTTMVGSALAEPASRMYVRSTMQPVTFVYDNNWFQHISVVKDTEYAIAIMSCYDSNFGDFVFNWEMDTSEDALPNAFGIPSVGNGNTPAQEAPVDVTTITTADNGVSTLVVDANTNELVFSDTDLDALRALAGVTTGDVFVQLDSGQVVQLSNLGKTKIRLGDTKNLKVIVPGAKVQDVVIQLKRTENGNTSSSSTSGGMSPISMILIAFLVLAVIGGGALQMRRKQGDN